MDVNGLRSFEITISELSDDLCKFHEQTLNYMKDYPEIKDLLWDISYKGYEFYSFLNDNIDILLDHVNKSYYLKLFNSNLDKLKYNCKMLKRQKKLVKVYQALAEAYTEVKQGTAEYEDLYPVLKEAVEQAQRDVGKYRARIRELKNGIKDYMKNTKRA